DHPLPAVDALVEDADGLDDGMNEKMLTRLAAKPGGTQEPARLDGAGGEDHLFRADDDAATVTVGGFDANGALAFAKEAAGGEARHDAGAFLRRARQIGEVHGALGVARAAEGTAARAGAACGISSHPAARPAQPFAAFLDEVVVAAGDVGRDRADL